VIIIPTKSGIRIELTRAEAIELADDLGGLYAGDQSVMDELADALSTRINEIVYPMEHVLLHYPCPLCAAIRFPPTISFADALTFLQAVCALPCRCMDRQHTPLAQHPHARPGCAGYAEVPDAHSRDLQELRTMLARGMRGLWA
jgi:hypothetical protein